MKKAFKCYLIAADKGNALAQFNLGLCYENATGTSLDLKKANEYYKNLQIKVIKKHITLLVLIIGLGK